MFVLFARVLSLCFATIGWCCVPASATTFFDSKTAFLAATGPTSTQGFGIGSSDWFVLRDFGDFGAAALAGASRQTRLRINDGKLVIDQNFTQAPPLFELTFAGGVFALGFDYWNTDTSGDLSEIEIAGERVPIGDPLGSGFFGAVWDAPLTSFRFYDNAGGGTNLAYVQYDNIVFSRLLAEAPPPTPTHAPLPAGIWLLGAALLALGALRGLRSGFTGAGFA